MKTLLKRFITEEEGLETVEYAIIAGLIVVGTIVFVANIGTWVNTQFGALDTGLNGAPA